MGKYPVTQAQWQAVAALPKIYYPLNPNPSKFKGANLPVEQVSWWDVVEFCARLSKKAGRQYRLPSEAEWEYACRAGTTTPFHFGETITADLANYKGIPWIPRMGTILKGSYGQGPPGISREGTTPVGSFGVANAFGLYDMHGNVWEWCQDHWHDNYEGAPTDGSMWSDNDDNDCRLLRGGSWQFVPQLCRSACRTQNIACSDSLLETNVGLRVVCDGELQGLHDKSPQVQYAAYSLLKDRDSSKLNRQLSDYLPRFEFEVVTVDAQGVVNSRSTKQAQFFAEDLGNGVTLEMVKIPSGTFLMGSPETEKGHQSTESPQHQVTVKSFFMSKYLVTQAQWQAIAALPRLFNTLVPLNRSKEFKGAFFPFVGKLKELSRLQEFFARLSQKTGRQYRLPSEAEWEYACRAGTNSPFHFGETITPDLANYYRDFAYTSEPKGEYRNQTTPVGHFRVANAFGLYDMHGNMGELCADGCHPNYKGAPTDGSVWNSHHKVMRGGYIKRRYNSPNTCRSAARTCTNSMNGSFGLRLVCEAAWTL